ncbi:phenylalanine--tRNA ligase subunit beta [Candidatus Gottesmanbacteria bacterium]|nr:phenylalanine--tRNA ligase subunit beta [Candidatus Gottesmanbacteria bacterium]
MNLLVPDSWLREFLVTKASPEKIKEYLSLCGPSVERMHKENGEVIYDIEVTSNRPDSMSILGIAREAAAILPRFGIAAKLVNNPYAIHSTPLKVQPLKGKKLNIQTDSQLNPRWTSVVIDNIKVGSSPAWLKKRLETTGIRSLNNIIDITNYIMRAYGQPVHAFDYHQVLPKNGIPTMLLRASKKGERVETLDGKMRVLPGNDIVIEDGSGRLIDLCGIMGAENSAVKSSTKTIVLFMQTYNPVNIRRTTMSLAHRTEAASLFEKGLDSELVYPSIVKGIQMVEQIAGGTVASKIYDIYPKPFKPYAVSVSKEKLMAYMGISLRDTEIANILTPLGFKCKIVIPGSTRNPSSSSRAGSRLKGRDDTVITVQVPSFRRDIEIDVDVIEEIARMYGYHNIKPKLPSTEPPMVIPDPTLSWEEEIKIRLRDWGYTETYTYSMISEELMGLFGLDKKKSYKIANPLSNEWVYMRPSLWPSLLTAVKQNLNYQSELTLFELSMIYEYRPNDLPNEKPVLLVCKTGNSFYELKGLAETLLKLFGIEEKAQPTKQYDWYSDRQLTYGAYGSLGEAHPRLLDKLTIKVPVTILELDFAKLVADAKPQKKYVPIPKFPPSYEDLALVVGPNTHIGPMIDALKTIDPLVVDVSLLDSYENIRTLHVTYLSPEKNLTTEDIRPIREKLLKVAQEKFNANLKNV